MSPSVSSPALIRSKRYFPRHAAHHKPRERLIDQLAATTQCALTLARVVSAAETDGWGRLFVDLEEKMKHLLTRVASRGISRHDIQGILHAFPIDHGPVDPVWSGCPAGLAEPISERELEVPTFLARRCSNKEIARRLSIAPATVKSHTINIYRKRNANDQREAAALANELGLVPMNA